MWSGVQLSNEVKWCNSEWVNWVMKWNHVIGLNHKGPVRKMSTLGDVLFSVAISIHYTSSDYFCGTFVLRMEWRETRNNWHQLCPSTLTSGKPLPFKPSVVSCSDQILNYYCIIINITKKIITWSQGSVFCNNTRLPLIKTHLIHVPFSTHVNQVRPTPTS